MSDWQVLREWLDHYGLIDESIVSPEQLTRLDISNRSLEALPEQLGLLNRLSALNLSNNKLTTLPESMSNLTRLNSLDIRRNGFESLPQLLGSLPLRSLNASANRLRSVDILKKCSELRVLDLSGNALSEIGGAFSVENELRSVNLSDNFLKELSDLFPLLPKVERLNLNGNLLSLLPESLSSMCSLEELEIADNRLEKIEEAFFALSLVKADLSSNRLEALELHSLEALQELILDENPLSTLNISEDFAPALRIFSCDGCALDEFSLPPSRVLETLCFSSNALTKVPEGIGRYAQLRELDIDGNAITELPDTLANLSHLKILYAKANPLSERAKKVISVLAPEICDLNMKTGISIERAREEDLEQMAKLLSLLFEIEKDFTFDFEKQHAGIKALFEDERSDLLVARHEESVVGMVTMQRLISSAEGGFAGQIEDLVVKESYQKMGVGSRLINRMRAIAQEYGYKRIQLAADVDNDNALQFYSRRGFFRTNLSIYHYSVS